MKRDLVFIGDWIISKKEVGMSIQEIADIIGTQSSMVSKYTQQHRIPSIGVATNVFLHDGTVVHPYKDASIVYEIERR